MDNFMRHAAVQFVDKGGQAITIQNLRIQFSVKKDNNPQPNDASVHIFNLAPSTLHKVLSKEYSILRVCAWYGDASDDPSSHVIFTGDIAKKLAKRDKLDIVLSVEAGDALKAYQESTVFMTVQAGATDEHLVKSIGDTMGLKPDSISVVNKAKYTRSVVLNGSSRDELSKLAHNNDAQWSIQDGALQFLPASHASKDAALVLSPETGMIASPEPTDTGLTVNCLLNPRLKIGSLVIVQSEVLNVTKGGAGANSSGSANYKVTSLTHTGDNMGGDWKTELSLVLGDFLRA